MNRHVLFAILCSQLAFAAENQNREDTDSVLRVGYRFGKVHVQQVANSENDCITVEGLAPFGEVGKPSLPMKTVNIALPVGYEMESMTITGEKRAIAGYYKIAPFQAGVPVSSFNIFRNDVRNESLYQSSDLYPATLNTEPLVGNVKGYQLISAMITPIQWRPSTGELFYFDTITVEISLKKLRSSSDLLRNISEDAEEVRSIVDNPTDLNDYPSQNRQRGYDGLIITGSNLKAEFEKLVTHKKNKGLAFRIASVSDIYSTMQGRDTQEKIRNYIIQEYKANAISYVILGGDVSVVPSRSFLRSNSTTLYPCDLYYSGLDGSWDADKNNNFGEWRKDSCDFYAEVTVGRLPVETPQEAAVVIGKTISFENSPRPKKVLLHGAMMSDIHSSRDVNEGNANMPIGTRHYIPSEYQITKLQQPESTPTSAEYVAGWKSGVLLVNHGAHGLENNYSVSRTTGTNSISFRSTDASALTNTVYPIHTSIACMVGAWDWEKEDCLAEQFLLNPNGGAVATVLNTRNGLYGGTTDPTTSNPARLSGEQIIDFYKQLFEKNVGTVGRAVQFARQTYAAKANSSTDYTQVQYVWNLMGDPSLNVFDKVVSIPEGSGSKKQSGVSISAIRGVQSRIAIRYNSEAIGGNISLFTLTGRLIETQRIESGIGEMITHSPIPSGIYLVNLRDGTGRSITQKVVHQ